MSGSLIVLSVWTTTTSKTHAKADKAAAGLDMSVVLSDSYYGISFRRAQVRWKEAAEKGDDHGKQGIRGNVH
jgi:hypothetical protein